MSSIVNPVGPDEPSTYWRRRAAVIVVLLFILWLGWLVVSSVFGGDDSVTADASPSPSFGLPLSESAKPSESATSEATASPTGESASAQPSEASVSPSTSSTESASADAKCPSSVIKVTVETASESVAVGAGMKLTMAVANTGDSPCTRNVGNGANEVQISSAGNLVWSSDHCNPSTAEKDEVIANGTPWTTPVTWNGRTSAVGCPTSPPLAQAGSYQVVARNGKVESEPVTFTVN